MKLQLRRGTGREFFVPRWAINSEICPSSEQLLQEAEGEPFLNGRRATSLHVLKTSACRRSEVSSDRQINGMSRALSSFPWTTPGPTFVFQAPPFLDSSPGPALRPQAFTPLIPPQPHPISFLSLAPLRYLDSPLPAYAGVPRVIPIGPDLGFQPSLPGDRVAIHLQELQQLLGLLPDLVLSLLGRERVVGNQQGMGPTTWDSEDQKLEELVGGGTQISL